MLKPETKGWIVVFVLDGVPVELVERVLDIVFVGVTLALFVGVWVAVRVPDVVGVPLRLDVGDPVDVKLGVLEDDGVFVRVDVDVSVEIPDKETE